MKTLTLKETVGKFVELMLKHKALFDVKNVLGMSAKKLPLNHEERNLIFYILRLTGFSPLNLVEGFLYRPSTRDCHPNNPLNERREDFTNRINNHFPYNVVCEDADENIFATELLEEVFSIIIRNKCGKKTQKTTVDELLKFIEQSAPLKPIQLTQFADFLVEPPVYGIHNHDKHCRDEHEIKLPNVGMHKYCRGSFEIIRTSKTFGALVCRKCSLRFDVPLSIKTYGELRERLWSSK